MTFPNDFHRHPKITRLPVEVRWAFVEMNGEAREADNDGVFDAADAEFLWPLDVLDQLVASHPTRPLVLRQGDKYVIRDYGEHQETKAAREARAAKNRANGQKGGRPRKNPVGSGPVSGGNPPGTGSQPNRTQHKAESESELETEIEDPVRQSSHVDSGEIDDGPDEAARVVLLGLGVNTDRLLHHIQERTGVVVSPAEAMRVATDILARGGDVMKPQAYVLRSITNDPDAIRAAITAARPTSIPQREPECAQHAGYPLPCERCRRDAAEKEKP
ncbi:hypothetical protein SK224_08070 [Microbacterium sp. BG28]|uniref:hypothetical protein n=1 Tax=Microbacterium sp. BG28 TaxID=3097356 RepID=UPI002A59BE31|nr:hypothetical protein [Microbacterium sp. BG28]MDY0829083.1 hypothetical protein [Microbacterium sp. BG28]